MSTRILIILGHPDSDTSFCAALAHHYLQGANNAGAARRRNGPALAPQPRNNGPGEDSYRHRASGAAVL